MPRIKKQQLKPRKDGRYCCKYKGIQFMGSTSDEALAKRDEYKRLENLGQRRSITVGEYAEQWLPIAYPDVADSTYTGLAIHLEKLVDSIGNELLSCVKPSQIKSVYSTAYKGLSNSYIRAGSQLFKALFDSAVSDGYCRTNPARDKTAKPHKGTIGGHRAITETERSWIENLCKDHRAYPMVMTMLYAGLRPQEVKAFVIERDVDFEHDLITIHESAHLDGYSYDVNEKGKTDKALRTIPLFAPLKKVLQDRTGYLATRSNGDRVNISAWKSLWNSYVYHMETAINGVHKRWWNGEGKWTEFTVVPYDLRHSFCTWGRDNGVELHTMVEWMGHTDSKMILKIYDEVSDNRSQKEAERLNKMLVSMQNGMQDKTEDNEGIDG